MSDMFNHEADAWEGLIFGEDDGGGHSSPPLVICPYCGKRAKLVTGEVIYPHRPDLHRWNYYRCAPCDAYVGCHRSQKEGGLGDGTVPLGRLANADLRRAKMIAHSAFDVLWKSGRMSRRAAYAWLATWMKVHPNDCHIGLFTVEQCWRVVALVREYRKTHGLPSK